MCGIFATTAPEVWRDKTDQVLGLLAHRGPDARSSQVFDEAVLLGHTRLEVIGLGSVGDQPAMSPDRSVSLVFNGEIYNYRELGREYHVREGCSDTKVLAAVIEDRQPASLSRLRGMFAFAAWDHRDGSLLAMRDPFGIKPLYVLHHPSGGVTLCSEIAPLLGCPDGCQLDAIGIGQYLAMGHTTNTHTFYSRIRKLDPGTLYIWRQNKGGRFDLRLIRPEQDVACRPTLVEALEDSVHAHLTADVEVGAFLSSGIDSTLLCALAREQVPRLHTYTIKMVEAPSSDESELASLNARALGLDHVEVEVRPRDMASAVTDLVRLQAEPIGDAAALPLSVLARRAAQDLKVVLSGEGADELFGGYGRYRVLRRFSVLNRAASPLTAPSARRWGRMRDHRPMSRAMEAVLWGGGIRSHAALLDGDLTLLSVVDPHVHRDVLGVMTAEWKRAADPSDLASALVYDRNSWLPNMYLEKTDRSTMQWGLEARVPYLDPVVAATAAAHSMELHAKRESRELLCERFPGVRLPDRKLGLAVDLAQLLGLPLLADALEFELSAGDSTLGRWISNGKRELVRARCGRSVTFAYRMAMLGIWDSVRPEGVSL